MQNNLGEAANAEEILKSTLLIETFRFEMLVFAKTKNLKYGRIILPADLFESCRQMGKGEKI